VLERLFNPARLLRLASSRSRRSIHVPDKSFAGVELPLVDPARPSPLASAVLDPLELQAPVASDWKGKFRMLKR
jgi:hypothetical protein